MENEIKWLWIAMLFFWCMILLIDVVEIPMIRKKYYNDFLEHEKSLYQYDRLLIKFDALLFKSRTDPKDYHLFKCYIGSSKAERPMKEKKRLTYND